MSRCRWPCQEVQELGEVRVGSLYSVGAVLVRMTSGEVVEKRMQLGQAGLLDTVTADGFADRHNHMSDRCYRKMQVVGFALMGTCKRIAAVAVAVAFAVAAVGGDDGAVGVEDT